ncbi:SCF ubiquitin ligase complex [Salix suchowensis]|nr:SCF ubiquitin ligase complex [Salix suchowensis]
MQTHYRRFHSDIWTHSMHMREVRLSHCTELTDAAFPATLRTDINNCNVPTHPFPLSKLSDDVELLPPLIITRTFEHLRMLDLSACANITDDAIEGIVSHAPKIRNLVLSKCALLTDRAVETICRLVGTYITYIWDMQSISQTDLSVLLREVARAVYSLAERHATLERIHLSYCDRISVGAIHFLLQKLHKLTHLSLTGVPAFRQPTLQRFCRPPPKAAFCVYSGKGVSQLRAFLTEYFDHMNENNGTDDTEYEDDYDGDGEVDGDADLEHSQDDDNLEPQDEEEGDEEVESTLRGSHTTFPPARVDLRAAAIQAAHLPHRRVPDTTHLNAAIPQNPQAIYLDPPQYYMHLRAIGAIDGPPRARVAVFGLTSQSLSHLTPRPERCSVKQEYTYEYYFDARVELRGDRAWERRASVRIYCPWFANHEWRERCPSTRRCRCWYGEWRVLEVDSSGGEPSRTGPYESRHLQHEQPSRSEARLEQPRQRQQPSNRHVSRGQALRSEEDSGHIDSRCRQCRSPPRANSKRPSKVLWVVSRALLIMPTPRQSSRAIIVRVNDTNHHRSSRTTAITMTPPIRLPSPLVSGTARRNPLLQKGITGAKRQTHGRSIDRVVQVHWAQSSQSSGGGQIPKAAAILKDTIEKHSLATASLDEKQASLFAALASAISKASEVGEQETSYIVARILDGKLKSIDQVSGEPASSVRNSLCSDVILVAVKYIESHRVPIDDVDFDVQCGVGMA